MGSPGLKNQQHRTSGPLVDWFYVHGGYMSGDIGNKAAATHDVPWGIELAVQPGEKSDALIAQDRPWEEPGLIELMRIYPRNGRFRMHYHAGKFSYLLVAESEDGFRWSKPELGAFEVNGSTRNNILDGKVQHIFEDPAAPAEERWKAMSMTAGLYEPELDSQGNPVMITANSQKAMDLIDVTVQEKTEDVFELQESPATRNTYRGKWAQLKGFLCGNISSDGLHWKMLEKYLLPEWVDGDNIVRYDEKLGQYVGHFRYHVAGRRCVGRSVSSDFRTFTPEKLAIRPDAMDPPDVSIYNHSWTKYPGRGDLDLMFLSMFHQGTGKMDIQLAVSHDGFYWDRPDRKTTLIPNGPDGSLDGGCIYVAPELVELPDGRWAIGYTGRAQRHIEIEDHDKYYADYFAQGGIFRYAMWERDRLVGICAREYGGFTLRQDLGRAPENCPDSIEAPPDNRFPPLKDPNEPPRQLKLNYKTEMGGWISVELIPVIGPMTHPQIDPLPGYTFADCDVLRGNELDKVVTWQGRSNIAGLSDTLAVRIKMFRATLFAFDLGVSE